VETPFGALRVLDSQGQRVDSGDVERPSGDTVAVGIDHTLADGTYTVAWSVISADTHLVHGAVVFSVGKPSANPNQVAATVRL
jgi:copper transport protein